MQSAKQKAQSLRALTDAILEQEEKLKEGGGEKGRARQKNLGRMTARERVMGLLDEDSFFLEAGLWAAYGMYEEVGGNVVAAGNVAGVGLVQGKPTMIIANDATVKAGAFFPMSCKKMLRAQRIAFENALPVIYLVDSAGAFLPMQDEVFPDEDDFGRIFRNNSVMCAAGLPQYAAIMGNCIAGGAYLPVLCDKLLMTEGSGLYLAGPNLVKAAIGMDYEAEELGGATMHMEISGTIDFKEKDDAACLKRLRSLMDMLPKKWDAVPNSHGAHNIRPDRYPEEVYEIVPAGGGEYDMREVIRCIVDAGSAEEFKKDYGRTIICDYAKIGGYPVGIVANQRLRCESPTEGIQIGGVIYDDSADKAARFVMDCNQNELPLIFLQDVFGFMVGKDAEERGIIRSGAKLVNAMSNSIVPKITVVVGGSFGAGNYAMCGKAYDPRFIFAWPNAKYAVMGAAQASNVLFSVQKAALEKSGAPYDENDLNELRDKIRARYEETTEITYAASRGWIDAIIPPHKTREILINCLGLVTRDMPKARFHTGVLQV